MADVLPLVYDAVIGTPRQISSEDRLSVPGGILSGGDIAATGGISSSNTIELDRITGGTTPTQLTTDGGVASSANIPSVGANQGATFHVLVTAQDEDGGVAGYRGMAVLKRAASAASTTLVGTQTLTELAENFNGTVELKADTTNGGLNVEVTGIASTQIRWHAVVTVSYVELPTYTNEFSVLTDGVDEYVSWGNIAALDFEWSDPFSIAVWFKGTDNNGDLFTKRDEADGSRGWAFQPVIVSGNKAQWLLRGNGRNVGIRINANINTGDWFHIVCTQDGSRSSSGFNVYLNGSLATVEATFDDLLAGDSIQNAGKATLGSRNGENNFVAANFDEAMVFDKELSAAEVTELYNGGEAINPRSLSMTANIITAIRCGDGDTYPTLLDYVNSNNATMVNMESGDIEADVP